MTIRTALAEATERLAAAGCDTPALDARVLLSHVTGADPATLLAHATDELPEGARDELERLLARRARREPVAYLTGSKEFFSLEFQVDRRVLVPRPETELVVEQALGLLQPWIAGAARSQLRVVDVGTGSGVVAVAIARALAMEPRAAGVALELLALDRSRAALEVARANTERLLPAGVEVALVQGDLLSAIAARTVDLVVANPPYLTPAEMATLPAEVRFEPRLALEGGSVDGLGVVEELLAGAYRVLRAGGAVVSEIGAEQERRAIELARGAGLEAARVCVDLAGRPRVLIARRS